MSKKKPKSDRRSTLQAEGQEEPSGQEGAEGTPQAPGEAHETGQDTGQESRESEEAKPPEEGEVTGQESRPSEEPSDVRESEQAQETPQAEVTPQAPPITEQEQVTLPDLLEYVHKLAEVLATHDHRLNAIEQNLAKPKRRPTSNGKTKVRDKLTGTIYPSKNNAYQTLLRSGELKDLVEKGMFGANPEKNNFGWFALVRAWPDRFEEVQEQAEEEK
jgi:hypothetical protein